MCLSKISYLRIQILLLTLLAFVCICNVEPAVSEDQELTDSCQELTWFKKIDKDILGFYMEKVKVCLDADVDTRLYLYSLGGNPGAALGFYDFVRSHKNASKLEIIAVGDVASSSVVVFLAGDDKKRFIYPNTTILIHGIRRVNVGSSLSGQQISEWHRDTALTTKSFCEIIADRTNLTKRQVENMMIQSSGIFDALDSVKKGFAMKIIEKGK